jgi:hypothetical protein
LFSLPHHFWHAVWHVKKGYRRKACQNPGKREILDEQIAKKLAQMGKPRLPWKRGPRAFEIAQRAEEILEVLNTSHRGFYSLRRTAKILGVSTQPARDWVRLGYLKRKGPRHQISRAEIESFVRMLAERAEVFDTWNYVNRIERNRKVPSWPWRKLITAKFIWPVGCEMLRPNKLAELIGCHPSLIIKAIKVDRVRGYRPTRYRWAIKRRSWKSAFFS